MSNLTAICSCQQADELESAGISCIFVDWKANRSRPQIQVLLAVKRSVEWLSDRPRSKIVRFPVTLAYKLLCLLLGIDLPPRTSVGPRLQIHHGVGLVIHPHARLCADVVLRHGVTIGNRGGGDGAAPVVHEGVEFGAGAVAIGRIEIGAGSRVGANAVLTVSVPNRSVVVAPPATIRTKPYLNTSEE